MIGPVVRRLDHLTTNLRNTADNNGLSVVIELTGEQINVGRGASNLQKATGSAESCPLTARKTLTP